jgi:tetratricopeptide (TPR) repeat protein
MREALLGVCAAHVRGRAGDASRWNEAVQQMQGRARNEMSPTGRAVGLPLAAAVARNGELLQQMADQMASSETLWAEALGDMVDRYKADPNATADEAAVLLEGLVAMDMQLETMARERAMEVLDRRPASMIAATLAMSTDPNEATAGRILSKMDPPDSATALRLRAAQLAKHSQYEQAAELYRQASDKAGQPVALRLQEAIVLEKAGKYPQALTLYQQLWQRHQLPVAGNNAANLVAKLYPDDPARLAEALEWADQLVRQSPGNPIYLDTRGWLSLLTGNQQQALTDLRQAVRGLRGWAQVHYHAGLAERATGDPTVATWQFQAAVDSYQRRKALDEPLPPEEVQAAELARKELAEEG